MRSELTGPDPHAAEQALAPRTGHPQNPQQPFPLLKLAATSLAASHGRSQLIQKKSKHFRGGGGAAMMEMGAMGLKSLRAEQEASEIRH